MATVTKPRILGAVGDVKRRVPVQLGPVSVGLRPMRASSPGGGIADPTKKSNLSE